MMDLEKRAESSPKRDIIIIGDINEDISRQAQEQGLKVTQYPSEEEYHRRQVENTSLGEFTRRSVVGAGYRVGASFTIDAILLTAVGAVGYYVAEKSGFRESISRSASEFVKNLDPYKLGRVAAAVIAINFADYKWDITNKLDKGARKIGKKIKSLFTRKR